MRNRGGCGGSGAAGPGSGDGSQRGGEERCRWRPRRRPTGDKVDLERGPRVREGEGAGEGRRRSDHPRRARGWAMPATLGWEEATVAGRRMWGRAGHHRPPCSMRRFRVCRCIEHHVYILMLVRRICILEILPPPPVNDTHAIPRFGQAFNRLSVTTSK
jgi:hypothetical protein